jgi:hypothetical protein
MPPKLIAIDHDDYQASHVGCTADGRQFFLTNPFIPTIGNEPGREFVSLYLFDAEGNFLEARIGDMGTRAELDVDGVQKVIEQHIKEIGPVEYGRIEIEPFQVEHFSTTFGLILHPPENEDNDDEDEWRVTVEPGDYMAFHEPWDSGEYDT